MCSVYSCMSPESASPCLQTHPPTSKLFLVAMTFSITINDNNWVHLHIIIFTYFMNHTFPLLFDIIKKITCIHCIFLCGEKEPFPSSLNWELNTVLLWSLSICSLVVDFFSCIIFAIKILIMFGLVLIFFFLTKIRDWSFVAFPPLSKEEVGKTCGTDFFNRPAEIILSFCSVWRFEEVKQ